MPRITSKSEISKMIRSAVKSLPDTLMGHERYTLVTRIGSPTRVATKKGCSKVVDEELK